MLADSHGRKHGHVHGKISGGIRLENFDRRASIFRKVAQGLQIDSVSLPVRLFPPEFYKIIKGLAGFCVFRQPVTGFRNRYRVKTFSRVESPPQYIRESLGGSDRLKALIRCGGSEVHSQTSKYRQYDYQLGQDSFHTAKIG